MNITKKMNLNKDSHPFRDAVLYFVSMCFAAAIGWIIWGSTIQDHLKYQELKKSLITSDISYDIDVKTRQYGMVDISIDHIKGVNGKYCTVILEEDNKFLYCGSIDADTVNTPNFDISLSFRPKQTKSVISVMVIQHDSLFDESFFSFRKVE